VSFLKKIQAKLRPANDDPDASLRKLLSDQGDDGSKERPVDHLAYFNSEEDSSAFAAYVLSQGFVVGEIDEEFGVSFTKTSSVVGEEFDQELATLREKADAMNGQYDGWGCPVSLDEDS